MNRNEAEKVKGIETDPVKKKNKSEDTGQSSEYLPPSNVYLPGMKLCNGEVLDYDKSAYLMLHHATTVAPCLSFDILPDNLGDGRTDFPHTMYFAAGTQAETARTNFIILMKASNIHKLKNDVNEDKDVDDEAEEESSDSDEDEEEQDPTMNAAQLKHNGSVNRIRVTMAGQRMLGATWSALGLVYIWDLNPLLQAVDSVDTLIKFIENRSSIEPLFTFSGHQMEGYALDWSRSMPGHLLSGDCNKNIHLWRLQNGGSWAVDQRPYAAHTGSVEDIQWSPNESNVFASCSVDRSIRIWDIRASPNKACMIVNENAHDKDVNVISWNLNDPFIVSGGDDGAIKVWDLREFKNNKSVACFKHHTAPITSVEWHPTESTIFAASGSDEQLSIWDLAIERDVDSLELENHSIKDLPPQLLFIHQGQEDIKEIHWHRQIPGAMISTSNDGFNIFKTISV